MANVLVRIKDPCIPLSSLSTLPFALGDLSQSRWEISKEEGFQSIYPTSAYHVVEYAPEGKNLIENALPIQSPTVLLTGQVLLSS